MGDCRTFEVEQVARATKPFKPITVEAAVTKRVKVHCEAMFDTPRNIVDLEFSTYDNKFLAAVHNAYSLHYPLILTPDVIWLCIAQGFATHVNANAERLRHLFVRHEGKKTLEVERTDMVRGSPGNPWPEVFDQFSRRIKVEVGDKIHGVLTPTFTTTGPVERAAAQLAVMDAFKEYFEYRVMCVCGIPEVTLEGTVEDWIALREKAMALAEFDLSWWTEALRPVLDHFVEAASGNVDRQFWSSIYKRSDEIYDGGPYVSGWITTFFPYTAKGEKNTYIHTWREDLNKYCEMKASSKHHDDWLNSPRLSGMKSNAFTPGVNATPFKMIWCDGVIPMHFYSGFLAVSQNRTTLALRPEIGWAVADDVEKTKTDDEWKARNEKNMRRMW